MRHQPGPGDRWGSEAVELFPAGVFTCPECGRDTFVRMITDVQEEEGRCRVMVPTVVHCRDCNLFYQIKWCPLFGVPAGAGGEGSPDGSPEPDGSE